MDPNTQHGKAYLNICRSPHVGEFRLRGRMYSGSGEGRQVAALLPPGHVHEVLFCVAELLRQGKHHSLQASVVACCAAGRRPSSVPQKGRYVW